MSDVNITPLPNGPYIVQGPAKLLNPDGTEVELKQEKIALCRCGASVSKPFCDGTHAQIGFQSESSESNAA